MKGIIVVAGILAAAVIAAAAIWAFNTEEELAEGDFTVYDESGGKRHLSDYAGKPIIFNMWATWCPSCRRELPVFEKLYKEYGYKVQFLMIDSETRQNFSAVKDYISEGRYTFPVLYDWDDSAYDVYGTGYIPHTVAINAEGEIIYNSKGRLSEKQLRSIIKAIL